MRAKPMTEADWNLCADPQVMLEFLRATRDAPERRLRCLAVTVQLA
jgi:hypothetical protein